MVLLEQILADPKVQYFQRKIKTVRLFSSEERRTKKKLIMKIVFISFYKGIFYKGISFIRGIVNVCVYIYTHLHVAYTYICNIYIYNMQMCNR